MKVAALVALLLAELSSCAGVVCPLAIDPEPSRLLVRERSAEDVVPLGADAYIVTALPRTTAMSVTRVDNGSEETVAATPALTPYSQSPSLVVTNNGWWFSRHGRERLRESVFFAVHDGEQSRQLRVDVPNRGESSVWLPISGPEPRGVLVTRPERTQTLRFDEITLAGTRPLGEIAWTAPERTFADIRWSAEVLGDGRIVITTVEETDERGRLRVYLLGDEITETLLPCGLAIDHAVDTAIDDSGTLAIVGLTRDGTVVATFTRIDALQSARCRVISSEGETAMTPPVGSPAVESTAEGFVAAWLRDDGTVRAATLRNLDAAPIVVDLGRASSSELPLRRLLHVRDEHVVFVWKATGGEVFERRVAHDVTGHEVAASLMRRWCDALERHRTR